MDDNERNHIKTFDCHGDQNTLGLRWKRWLTAFELFADGKGLILNEDNANNRQKRRALMLHLEGPDVQDIFLTLPNKGDVKDYRKAVDALNAYFAPKVDTTYARHCFRQLIQAPGETIRQFATRLRGASKDCDDGEDTDNQIRNEILCKCTSTYIKRKLLEECQGRTLARALEIAENCEKVGAQLAAMTIEEKGENSASVNRIEEQREAMARKISHEVPKPAMRKLATDVVEPDISVEILTVQQEVNFFIDVGWKDICKSSARQSRKVKKSKKKPKATGTPREVLQIWLVATTKKRNQCMLLR